MEVVKEIVQTVKSESLEEEDILMNLIHELQKRYGHFVPKDVVENVAVELGIPTSRVYEVMTFYTMFSVEKKGKHIIRVCTSLPCHVAGGREIVERIKEELGIDFGQTTKDGLFSLEWTGCLGLCGVGPVIMIDNDFYGNLTPDDISEILNRYRGGEEI